MDFSKLYIDGAWVQAHSDQWIEVENPATREIIAKVPAADEKDVEQAVQAAGRALYGWSQMPAQERRDIILKAKKLLEENKQAVADLIVSELGAPKNWALRVQTEGPLLKMENYVKFHKDFAEVEQKEGYQIYREPVGVVACLTPWNYPLNQVIQKVIPAMLTGNTVILKPSQNTPLSVYYLADALHRAGLPAGVFNLVTGKGAEVGNLLAKHKDVDMISFTGSTSGGKEVAKLAMDTVKKIALELGGKSPSIILPGADLDLAVRKNMDSVFNNTGQTCAAWTRMLVHEDLIEDVVQKLKDNLDRYIVGDPTREEVRVGPLSSKKQYDKVQKYLKLGQKEGAELIIGEVPRDDSKGYFVKPAVFKNVSNDMRIAQEEIFGPVITIIPFSTTEQAIALGNATIYGLSGAVFGPEQEAHAVAKQLKSGNVYVNEGKAVEGAPFGGYKQSGIGREGGPFGFEEFVEIKVIFT